LEEFEPIISDVVINTAGKTDLPWCEENQEQAVLTNTVWPVQLYERCLRANARLIQISSGCVWKGPFRYDGKPFGPEDKTDPACFYALTKAACDAALMQMQTAHGVRDLAILRLRMPYSPIRSPRNLLAKLQNYPDLINEPNSITSADTLVKTIECLLEDAELSLWGRMSCIYDRGVITPYAIGEMLANAGLRDHPGRLSKTDLDAFHVPQRVDVVMQDPVFENAINPPSVLGELERVIDFYARSSTSTST
jgi:dTDP-4-dehydrorhamnose reductase